MCSPFGTAAQQVCASQLTFDGTDACLCTLVSAGNFTSAGCDYRSILSRENFQCSLAQVLLRNGDERTEVVLRVTRSSCFDLDAGPGLAEAFTLIGSNEMLAWSHFGGEQRQHLLETFRRT